MSRVIIENDGEFLWRTVINKARKYRISTKIKVLRHENFGSDTMVVLP